MENLTSHDHVHSDANGGNEGGGTQSQVIGEIIQGSQAPILTERVPTPEDALRDDQRKDANSSALLNTNIQSKKSEVSELPVKGKESYGLPDAEHERSGEDSEGVSGDKITAKEADLKAEVKEKKKPLLYPYRPADMSFWDSMQKHREGTDDPPKQPPVKTTKVVRRSKLQTTADLLAKLRDAAAVSEPVKKEATSMQQAKTKEAKRVVVIVKGSTPPLASGKETLPCESGPGVEKETNDSKTAEPVRERNDKKASTKSQAAINEDKKNVSPTDLHDIEGENTRNLPPVERPEARLASAAASTIIKKTKSNNTSGAVVKKGTVQKRVKISQKPLKEAPREVHITAVKVDPFIQELRALRNKPLVEDEPTTHPRAPANNSTTSGLHELEGVSGQQTQGNVNNIHEEISKILLDYCCSEGTSDKGAGATERPSALTNEKTCLENAPDGSGHARGGGGVAAGATGAAPVESVNAESSPEMLLYNRVIQLCQRDDVTPTILEVLYELIKHTRVIKLPPSSASVTSGGQNQEAASPDPSSNASDNIEKRRRQYAQQVILVLINQIRQQKLTDEYRRKLLHDQKQIATGKRCEGASLAPYNFSSLTGPFSGSFQHEQSQKTLFVPQGENRVGSSLNPAAAAFQISSKAPPASADPVTQRPHTTQATPMNPYAAPFVAKSTQQPLKAKEATSFPPCGFLLEEKLVSLLENFKERLLSWTSAAPPVTVNITSQERQALMGMQESFKRAIVTATSPSPAQPSGAPVEAVSHKGDTSGRHNTWSFVAFDSGDEMNPTGTNWYPSREIPRSDGAYVNPPKFVDANAYARVRYPSGLHRTVFTYKTVQLSSTDENSPSVWSHSENNTLMDDHPVVAPNHHQNMAALGLKPGFQLRHDAQKDVGAQSSFNYNAKPFTPGDGNAQTVDGNRGMNVNAPSFMPALLATTKPVNSVAKDK